VPGAAGDYLLNSGYAGYNTAEDVWVSGGSLYLQNQKRSYTGTNPAGSYDYTTGWIMSMHKVHFNKGYVECRAQFPSGDKVWPALWLIAEDLVWGPEWDMWEYFGYRSDYGYDVMMMNLAYGSYPNINWLGDHIDNYDTVYDCEAWHVYGFEWTEDFAKFYIDGSLVYQMNNTIGGNWPDEEMYIVLNNGVRTSSPDTNTTWPNYVVMDYIELYEYTPGVCDDGTCDPGEDQCNCPEDCGTPPTTETTCDDGVDEDCDGDVDCADADCGSDPECLWTKVDDGHASISYSADWGTYSGNPGYMGTEHYSWTTGGVATFSFTGTKARYYGFKRNDLGYANIYVDTVFQTSIDCYNSSGMYDVLLYETAELSNGPHTLAIEVSGTYNPASTDPAHPEVIVDAFEYSQAITIAGDLTLDGKVDNADVAELSQGWQTLYDFNTLLDVAQEWLYGTSP
jgi:hypothetical protein